LSFNKGDFCLSRFIKKAHIMGKKKKLEEMNIKATLLMMSFNDKDIEDVDVPAGNLCGLIGKSSKTSMMRIQEGTSHLIMQIR